MNTKVNNMISNSGNEVVNKKHPKAGKMCKCCGHLIVWIKYKGYKCMCDKCLTD